MQQPNTYSYAAFISYCHAEADAQWAAWLQEALEGFETPDSLVEQSYSESLGTLLVDDTEMSALSNTGGAIIRKIYNHLNHFIAANVPDVNAKPTLDPHGVATYCWAYVTRGEL